MTKKLNLGLVRKVALASVIVGSIGCSSKQMQDLSIYSEPMLEMTKSQTQGIIRNLGRDGKMAQEYSLGDINSQYCDINGRLVILPNYSGFGSASLEDIKNRSDLENLGTCYINGQEITLQRNELGDIFSMRYF